MENITKPALNRLARRAGVKSVSDDTIPMIRQLICSHLAEILNVAVVVNSEHQTKTLMSSDIYESFPLIGKHIAHSTDLNTTSCTK